MHHIGIDVHLKYSQVCELSARGKILNEEKIPTTEAGLRRYFSKRDRARVIMESGGSTPWVRRLLEQLDHEVLVVNPRRVRLIAESTLKSDRIDAEILARLSRADLGLLRPVYQRSQAGQLLRTQMRARTSLVKTRTSLINTVRGTLRAHGYRLRSCTAASFVIRFYELKLNEDIAAALAPLLETLDELSQRIEALDKELAELAKFDELPLRLQTVPGVGPIVSLAFIAWMDRPERFTNSRDVGACLGLRPRVRDSGDRACRGKITREGDGEMRRLLVQAAHAALNSRKDSALKQWALRLVERNGKKKATVALARKIAVLLHRLWSTGESFRAFPQAT